MRAAAALVLALVLAPPVSATPVGKLPETSCEEQCEAQRVRDDAQCDRGSLAEADRGLCHQVVTASLDLCLRLCEE